MTTTQHTPDTFVPVNEAENEHLARRRITRAVETAKNRGDVIDTDTARLIAATIHRGPTTALGRFAATGELDRQLAGIELWESNIHELRPSWWNALDTYLNEEATHAAA